jgi:phosphopantothenoylcysteine decarboxylase/phosphopantothenate--cysteine ligase
MPLLVTIGATQEPLDAMRILSNRSTGELGTRLALTLADFGHRVITLRSTGATADPSLLRERGIEILPFTTTEELRSLLEQTAKSQKVDAIFHTAAVSDFYLPGAGVGKIPTGHGPLTLTLEPTPKILPLLRGWFPEAQIIGWKFEASGDRAAALSAARSQIIKSHTDACVLNGPSYGEGFGFIEKSGELQHLPDRPALCAFLGEKIGSHFSQS